MCMLLEVTAIGKLKESFKIKEKKEKNPYTDRVMH